MLPPDLTLVACWLATYALHSTVLTGLAAAFVRLPLFDGARLQEGVWKGVLVGALCTATVQLAAGPGLVGWTLAQPRSESGFIISVVEATELTSPTADAAEVRAPRRSMPAAPVGNQPRVPAPWPPVVVGLWMLGAVVALGRRVRGRRTFFREIGPRRPVSDAYAIDVANRLARLAGLRRPVRVTTAPGLTVPVALGRDEVCLPGRALVDLGESRLHALLAHEVAHLARRDPLWLVAFTVLEGAFFFQPLARYARGQFEASAERLCDAWAAERTGPRDVAACLVEVASWTVAPLRVAVAGMAVRRSGLEERVQAALAGWGGGRLRPSAITVGLAAIVAVGWVGPGVAPRPVLAAVPAPTDHTDAEPGGVWIEAPVVWIDGKKAAEFEPGVRASATDSMAVVSVFDEHMGLVQFSTRPFEGSVPEGTFRGDRVEFAWGGRVFVVRSRAERPITDATVAHVRFVEPADVKRRQDSPRWLSVGPSGSATGPIPPVLPEPIAETAGRQTPVDISRPEPPMPPQIPSRLQSTTEPVTGETSHTLVLRHARVWIDGEPVPMSATYIGADGHLMLNEPGVGLFVVSLVPLGEGLGDGGPAGTFEGSTLRFAAGDHTVVIESDGPIATGGRADAFVRFVAGAAGRRSLGGGSVSGAVTRLEKAEAASGRRRSP